MASSNRTVRLECQNCGRFGSAEWGPDAAGTPRQLAKLSTGFLSIDTGKSEGPLIVCQTCRTHPEERADRPEIS